MKTRLIKPRKNTKSYYDYHECRNYLQKKYKYDERDYSGHFKNESKPYQDFWHWVIERYEVHNGCYVYFEKDELEFIKEDWIKEIFSHYIDEFADKKGDLEMYVWW